MSGGSKEGGGGTRDSESALLTVLMMSRCAVGMCGAEPRGGQSGADQLETDAHQETRPYHYYCSSCYFLLHIILLYNQYFFHIQTLFKNFLQ